MSREETSASRIADFLEYLDSERRVLTVLNRADPDPVYDMLSAMFGQENTTVREAETGLGQPANAVVLSDGERTLGVSELSDVRDALLLVNSDVYTTGARSIDQVDTPEVIARLDDTLVFAEGYPDTRKRKMLLVEMSRHIERRAWQVGEGRLRSGFQSLARIDDESGTRQVYGRLGATDLEVHVYGTPDWEPPDSFDLTVHGAKTRDLRESWFVVYEPPRDEERAAALVAVEDELGSNDWQAYWTYDPDRVESISRYLRSRY